MVITNKEEIVIDENKCAIYKIYQETDEDVLNKKLYVFNNELGTIKEIMLYKSQLNEANSKIEKIREYATNENDDFREHFSNDCDLINVKLDILSIIEGDKK